MLGTHETDLRIIAAATGRAVTLPELHQKLNDDGECPLSETTIKRHLPGLMKLRRIHGEMTFRNNRMVTVWLAVGLDEQPE